MNRYIDLLITFGPCQPATTRYRYNGTHWQVADTLHENVRLLVCYDTQETASVPPLIRKEDRTFKLWILGELWESTPNRAVCSTATIFDRFWEQFTEGKIRVNELNGHFLLCGWDKLHHRCHIWTNRFGTIHAYHATHGNKGAVGTFFPVISEAVSQRQLDWTALTSFFRFGFFLQDRTFFEDVRILRPASHYVFDVNGQILFQERYWNWWHVPFWQRSYDETLDEFANIFHQVMDDYTSEGRVAIPISGGLDSRSTVAAITRPERILPSKLQLWSYSYGYSDDSVETRIARRVANARHLPFTAYTIRPYLFETLANILAYTEGFQDITQCRQMFVRESIAERADILISALWGDVWFDDMGLVGQRNRLSESELASYAMTKIEKRGSNWLLEHICQPRLKEDPERFLKSMVQEELMSLNMIEDQDFRVKAFKTEQWSFRWSLPPIRVFQSAALPRLVFYDTRLTDFFCTVPSSFLCGRRLQIDYLKRYAPDLARITWQARDTNLYRLQYFNTWLLPKRALKKAWRVLSGKHVIERNWEVQFLCKEGQHGLNQWLLRPGLRVHEFVSPLAIRTLLETFFAAPFEKNRGYTVSMLLTFSSWLEHYGW